MAQSDAKLHAMYLRISKDDKKKLTSLGIEAQRTVCVAKAKELGLGELAVYLDENVSGKRAPEQRPGMARLLTDMRARRIGTLVVAALDRLSRRTIDLLRLREELQRIGVDLVSCRESFIDSTPIGNFMVSQMAALAQFEADIISKRTRDALAEKRRLVGRPSGRLPYGYVWENKAIKIDPAAAEVVRLIFKLRRQGKTLRAICEQIAVFAKPHVAEQWRHSAIRIILNNEAVYQGKTALQAILGRRAA